ncbi:MAG: hypothetical protein A2756_04220 [Candidatus Ryanbacteria bacterium RIFCSPHIGHO2_01_FULL_48_27]|uniref:YHYH domain-containing protein n=1 Tax=Candidatus Ryanbacteria bacterium RIFCSPHIGHO2_01_FULL_48_27 TaxID=1802115 RepID=A0A1G2G2C9_9BACT|nr:MAG: hypothetical protein A2756_04220 [Candidatus Ryanbacteria bacterium RIFCSPHIGHO2_01_FULL_48_27]
MRSQYLMYGYFLAVVFLFIPLAANAHPGNTDAYGCHTCRTNCSKWGLSSGEYHCHNAKALPQPEAPIRSHYNETGGTTEPWPEYEGTSAAPSKINAAPSAPVTTVSCPNGYTRSKKSNVCITNDQSCVEQVGPSTYKEYPNGMGAACNCLSGYEWDVSTLHCLKRPVLDGENGIGVMVPAEGLVPVVAPVVKYTPPPTVIPATKTEKQSWIQKLFSWLF